MDLDGHLLWDNHTYCAPVPGTATIDVQGGDDRRALAARRPGRQSADDITVFKSVGLIAYDLAAASAAYNAARKTQ